MPDDQTITEAIGLAERLLDEVARTEPTWQAIEHLADALAKLGAAAARARSAGEGAGPPGSD